MSGHCLLKICKDKRHELSSYTTSIGRKQMSYRISYAIMDYMQDNHKTRNDVAEELGVSPQFVSKILSGSHYMDLKDFVKWVL
jgi:antitoxin component HigA of HigAB toxin-antitoxin module